MTAESSTQTIRDVIYRETPERTLRLDLMLPATRSPQPVPAILHLHGGGWYTGDKSAAANHFLAQAGYVTASAQYRLSHQATFPAPIHDVKVAVRWLRSNAANHNIDPARIGVWGHSAGGHMAAFLGTSAGLADFEDDDVGEIDASVQAVVNVSGITTLNDGRARSADSPAARLLGAAPQDVPDLARAFSPATHIRPKGMLPPFLHLHGSADTFVPIKHAEFLHDKLRAAGVDSTLIPVAGGDHMLRDQWPLVEQLTRQFFNRVLKGALPD